MTASLPVPPSDVLVLPAIALAAGIDLYLTLLVLAVAPATGWWPQPPGALDQLDSTGVVLIVGSFYLLEAFAERVPGVAVVWNAFHAAIRPLAGALLALLILDGRPAPALAVGAAATGLVAAAAHAAATGGGVLLWLTGDRRARPLLVAAAEDVGALALALLALDRPGTSAAVAALATCLALPFAPSQVRAFWFTVRLAVVRALGPLARSRWRDAKDFPRWVRSALPLDAFGGGLRGSPAAAIGLPGAPRFARGWIVVRGDAPSFVYGVPGRRRHVPLDGFRGRGVSEASLFRRVRLEAPGGARTSFYLGLDGPGPGSLEAEFPG